jgi:molecular chaperone HscB
MAVQYAAFINEAFNVLSAKLSRAQYLLRLNGITLDQKGTADIDAQFLMEQVDLREALADIKSQKGPATELKNIRLQVQQQSQKLMDEYSSRIGEGDLMGAKKAVLKLQFMDKITQDIDLLEEDLFD